jgi:hypothetical protein
LKIDNTILEEFLPRLIDPRLVPGLARLKNVITGPQTSYAGMSFTFANLPINMGGIDFKTKNQDFTAGKRFYIKLSPSESFPNSDTLATSINVAYFAAEVKTNNLTPE